MALIDIQTIDGPRKAHVCDYCRTVILPNNMRFCSGHCSRNYWEQKQLERERKERGATA